MNTRKDYENDVARLGKFEGEAPYVPYFWDQFMEGGADEDFGRTLRFEVTPQDVELFPELADTADVFLYERDDGFVCECDGPGDDEFESSSDF